MTDVISVRFRSGCKEYYFDPKGLTIPAGTDVIVETAQGPEFAHCAAGNHQVPESKRISSRKLYLCRDHIHMDLLLLYPARTDPAIIIFHLFFQFFFRFCKINF